MKKILILSLLLVSSCTYHLPFTVLYKAPTDAAGRCALTIGDGDYRFDISPSQENCLHNIGDQIK